MKPLAGLCRCKAGVNPNSPAGALSGKEIAVITEILALAAKLPAGLPDPAASFKLNREEEELFIAIADHDHDGALTEVADVAYYAIKVIHLAASRLDLDVDTALRLAVAKYSLRARPGNPKDDAAERAACLEAVTGKYDVVIKGHECVYIDTVTGFHRDDTPVEQDGSCCGCGMI